MVETWRGKKAETQQICNPKAKKRNGTRESEGTATKNSRKNKTRRRNVKENTRIESNQVEKHSPSTSPRSVRAPPNRSWAVGVLATLPPRFPAPPSPTPALTQACAKRLLSIVFNFCCRHMDAAGIGSGTGRCKRTISTPPFQLETAPFVGEWQVRQRLRAVERRRDVSVQ